MRAETLPGCARGRAFSAAAFDRAETLVAPPRPAPGSPAARASPARRPGPRQGDARATDEKARRAARGAGHRVPGPRDAQERRVLNCVVKRYLQRAGFRSPASPCEEVRDQDLDDLDAVALSDAPSGRSPAPWDPPAPADRPAAASRGGSRADLLALYRGRIGRRGRRGLQRR